MIIRKPQLIIQDFQAMQNTYTIDQLKKRILNKNKLQAVLDLIKVASKARQHNCAKNISQMAQTLSCALLTQNQLAKNSQQLQKVLEFLLLQIENRDNISQSQQSMTQNFDDEQESQELSNMVQNELDDDMRLEIA